MSFLWVQNAKPIFSDYAENFNLYLVNPSSMAKIITATRFDYPRYTDIKGESCTVKDKTLTAEDIFNEYNATLVFTETVANTVNYYGYSNEIKYRKTLGDKIVNIHISVSENGVTVGSPIIFGSF